MKTIETKVYTFDELSDEAKDKARQWFYEGSFDYEWWDSTYEDAKTIGLKITSFDLDRNRHAEGSFINDAESCAKAIIENHGEACETYKTAKAFLSSLQSLNEKYEDEAAVDYDDKYQEETEALEDEFLKDILEDYSIMLQEETEYMSTPEYIDENILANDYTFTADGKRFG